MCKTEIAEKKAIFMTPALIHLGINSKSLYSIHYTVSIVIAVTSHGVKQKLSIADHHSKWLGIQYKKYISRDIRTLSICSVVQMVEKRHHSRKNRALLSNRFDGKDLNQ